MKYLLILLTMISSLTLYNISYGQDHTQLKVIDAEYTTKDKVLEYVISIKKDGIYKISVISPNGELISIPINNGKYKAGQKAKFSINSKYWNPGAYNVIIEKDKIFVERRRINIISDKAKKERDSSRKANSKLKHQ